MNHPKRHAITPPSILHRHPEIKEEIKNVSMFFNIEAWMGNQMSFEDGLKVLEPSPTQQLMVCNRSWHGAQNCAWCGRKHETFIKSLECAGEFCITRATVYCAFRLCRRYSILSSWQSSKSATLIIFLFHKWGSGRISNLSWNKREKHEFKLRNPALGFACPDHSTLLPAIAFGCSILQRKKWRLRGQMERKEQSRGSHLSLTDSVSMQRSAKLLIVGDGLPQPFGGHTVGVDTGSTHAEGSAVWATPGTLWTVECKTWQEAGKGEARGCGLRAQPFWRRQGAVRLSEEG